MPVSDFYNIPAIVEEVARVKPRGILDLGVGFGKYGALCREVLDAAEGRVAPKSWKALICGIEGFEAYRNPLWDMYQNVTIGNFADRYATIQGWPMILMIDSLEHLPKADALVVLQHLIQNNSQVIVSVPVGNWPQGAVFGNELERHLSVWEGHTEFNAYDYRVLYNGPKLQKGACVVVSIKGEYNNGKPDQSE